MIKDLEIHQDARGWLVEVLKREGIKQVYVASIEPGFVRGNHYHLEKTEWFFVIGKSVEIVIEDIKTKTREIIDTKDMKVVTMLPKKAHAVKNLGSETIYLVSIVDHIYDPKNTDTFPYNLYE